MTIQHLMPYARAEVAGLTTNSDGVWLATSVGLYSCRTRQFVPHWQGKAVRAIVEANNGGIFLEVTDSDTRDLRHATAHPPELPLSSRSSFPLCLR
jgi:hypothetical protein